MAVVFRLANIYTAVIKFGSTEYGYYVVFYSNIANYLYRPINSQTSPTE